MRVLQWVKPEKTKWNTKKDQERKKKKVAVKFKNTDTIINKKGKKKNLAGKHQLDISGSEHTTE